MGSRREEREGEAGQPWLPAGFSRESGEKVSLGKKMGGVGCVSVYSV